MFGILIFSVLFMRVSATTSSISAFAVRSATNRSVWFRVFVFVRGKDGRTPNSNSATTSSLGPIVPLIVCASHAMIFFRYEDVKILRRKLLYISSLQHCVILCY